MSGLFLFLSMAVFGLLHKILATKHETVTQILFTHNLILGQLFGRTLEQNLSFKQQISTIGNTQRLLHIVVSNQNADIPILQLPHNLLNILHCNRVYTGKRLVQHNKFGVNGQTTGNFCTAPLAT